MSWGAIFDHWAVVEVDLQDLGIDIRDPELMRSRSWGWLSLRVLGLLSADRGPHGDGGSRLQRVLWPVEKKHPVPIYFPR